MQAFQLMPKDAPPPGQGQTDGLMSFDDAPGAAGLGGQNYMAVSSVSNFTAIEDALPASGSKALRILATLILAPFAIIAAYAGYAHFVDDENVIAELPSLITEIKLSLGLEVEEPEDVPLVPRRQKKRIQAIVKEVVPVKQTEVIETFALKPVVNGDYRQLPNFLSGTKPKIRRLWSAEEEEIWRTNLVDAFAYQHFKTVKEVREGMLEGSEVILSEAVQSKKLWTRMHALMGLADFGRSLSKEDIERSLRGVETSQLNRFFTRFINHSTAGERFVMRAALPIVAPSTRIVILRALDGKAAQDDALRDIYMQTAKHDAAKSVAQFANRALAMRPFEERKLSKEEIHLALATDKHSGARVMDAAVETKPAAPSALSVPNDPEADATDVQFYDLNSEQR